MTYRKARFAYTVEGKGTPLVFLHGFLENQNMWKELADALPGDYQKVFVDLPGHGESENLGYLHTMEDMAGMINALTEELRLTKFYLMGHSMGGYVALAFAERYPEKLFGLILQNSTALADSVQKKNDRRRAIAAVKSSHSGFIRESIPNLFNPENRGIHLEKIEELKEEALQTSQQGIIAAMEGMRIRPDRQHLLNSESFEVLFIAAQNDPVLPWESLEPQLKATAVTPVITTNGHMAHIEDKEVLTESIRGFVMR